MEITRSMDKIAHIEIADLSYHMDKESVRCDIKWKTEKAIDRSLIKLTREFIVRYIKLKKTMTRGKCHTICLSWVISDNEITSTIWIIFTGIYDFLDLIYSFTIKISPLISIHWSQISPCFCKIWIIFYIFYEELELVIPFRCVFWIFLCEITFLEIVLKGPLVPDTNIIIDKIFDISITREEPEKLMNDAFCKYFYGYDLLILCISNSQWK